MRQLPMIEEKFDEIFAELEKEVMEILSDQSLDKRQTNLWMKPLSSTKQILANALESIRMVDRLAREESEKD
ncbi:hypothetical protein [Nitratifractor sp.]